MADDRWLLANEDGSRYWEDVGGVAPPTAEQENTIHVYLPLKLLGWLCTVGVHKDKHAMPTVTVWRNADAERWYGVLHDRARGLSLFRSAEELSDLLDRLSRALEASPAGWTPDRESH